MTATSLQRLLVLERIWHGRRPFPDLSLITVAHRPGRVVVDQLVTADSE